MLTHACGAFSTELIKRLIPLVPPEHLTLEAEGNGHTPIKRAFEENHGTLHHLILILIGVPLHPQDIHPAKCDGYGPSLLPARARLLAWLNSQIALRHTFTTLILGCGVHGSHDVPPAQRS